MNTIGWLDIWAYFTVNKMRALCHNRLIHKKNLMFGHHWLSEKNVDVQIDEFVLIELFPQYNFGRRPEDELYLYMTPLICGRKETSLWFSWFKDEVLNYVLLCLNILLPMPLIWRLRLIRLEDLPVELQLLRTTE